MWRRGADSDGYVANFVESEQIVKLNGFTASFVQVYIFVSSLHFDVSGVIIKIIIIIVVIIFFYRSEDQYHFYGNKLLI